jgi:hypothetical protein
MKINKIWVISLNATDPKTQKEIADRLNQCDFTQGTHFEILQAFDGRDGAVAEGYKPYLGWQVAQDNPHSWNDWWTRPVLPGEMGCATSHRMVWEKIALQGVDNVLILEDDFLCNNSIASLPEPPNEDWDIALLGRDKIEADVEEESLDATWEKPRHFYNLHAYVLNKAFVANMLLSGGLKENVIPVDEYVSALGYEHRRGDIVNLFPPALNIIATKDLSYVQQRRPHKESSIENVRPGIIELNQTNMEQNNQQEPYFEILDDSDWEAWKLKYLNLSMVKHEFELMVTDRGDNVYEFPLFTPKFCKEAVALANAKDEWTIDRHEFYPTNDVLLHEIGLDAIYNRVLDEVVRPLAIHLWNLEGKSWDAFSNENFMARYTTDRQSHLSLHHDRSHLTMVIKLNDEFSGGGTWFPQYQKLSNPTEIGTAVLHPGMITHRHGARPITMGKRYIIVSFIRSHLEP